MAANQGLYNGFLEVGPIWFLLIKDRSWRFNVAMCFLIFVAIAGVFGAATVSLMIMLVQTVPAVAAIVLAYLAYRKAADRRVWTTVTLDHQRFPVH